RTQQGCISSNPVDQRQPVLNVLIHQRRHSVSSLFHACTSGHSATTERNVGSISRAYNVVVRNELCPSTSAIDFNPTPSCFIRVATVWRSMCVPYFKSFIPERCQATRTIVLSDATVAGLPRGCV